MNKMNVTIKKSTKITNETEWFLMAPPKKGIKQWKDGYSAKELAKYATSKGKLLELMQSVFEEISYSTDDSFIGVPEAETILPGEGEGRNHDLLLYNEDLVIGIEAKVNEKFGDTIKKESENVTDNKAARIKELKRIVFRNPDSPDVEELRYQLLTATAGTLLEAANRKIKKCIFLVLSFHQKGKKANKRNKVAFENFVRLVCDKNKKSSVFNLDKEEGIECWFIEREITFTPEEFTIDSK